jgi:putative acetyltransferase
MDIRIAPERADTPEALALLEAGDAYAAALYPAESNHMIDASTLMQPHIAFFVARVDGMAAATGAAARYDGYGEIKRMYVMPQYRGLGLGKRMLEHVCAHMRAQGLPFARLETGVISVEARTLYERAGFTLIGPFGDYRPDPNSVFYELALG